MLGLHKIVGYISYEWHGSLWHFHTALEDGLERVGVAIVDLGVITVLAHNGAVKIDTCKQALASRISQEFGVHFPIGGCLTVAPNGTSRSCRIAANLEFVLEQVLEAVLVHSHQHEISGLAANLQSPGAACHTDKDWRAPTLAGAACNHALAVL